MTAPIAAGYIPLGIAYGILVMQLGMPWWMAPALSIAAFSGSAELLVITLAASYTPIAVIAVTMLLVNFRHLFYAFSFPLHLVEGRFARFFSMYALVDEAYAITAAVWLAFLQGLSFPLRSRAWISRSRHCSLR